MRQALENQHSGTSDLALGEVLNALGFMGRPLYLTPEFYANKPVDRLIIQEGGQQQEMILNLRDIHRHILAFFNVHVRSIYGLP